MSEPFYSREFNFYCRILMLFFCRVSRIDLGKVLLAKFPSWFRLVSCQRYGWQQKFWLWYNFQLGTFLLSLFIHFLLPLFHPLSSSLSVSLLYAYIQNGEKNDDFLIHDLGWFQDCIKSEKIVGKSWHTCETSYITLITLITSFINYLLTTRSIQTFHEWMDSLFSFSHFFHSSPSSLSFLSLSPFFPIYSSFLPFHFYFDPKLPEEIMLHIC